MRKAAIRALMARAVTSRDVATHGADLVGQVSASAAEMLRKRRDASVVAERRRRAARRRVTAWSAGTVVSAGVATTTVVTAVNQSWTAGQIGALIIFIGLLCWFVTGLIRAVKDLRERTRVVRSLPPPQVSRPAVTSAIRPDMDRLDGYSDGLRHLVSMIGGSEPPKMISELNADILNAADSAEARLRTHSAELTGLVRARLTAPQGARPGIDATVATLTAQVRAGVENYGQLVTAASEAVAASRTLASQNVLQPPSELQEQADQLRSLAIGMRELTD